ncbi:hypothetical protein L6164_035383 [Bauhinia variegata]|uniref:Uncharacterized protein n=1 Tax=Bauhinia variegata TaxID=167791 RepID=A0ACB9KDS1_BAUVA|nr:hypothetical protein L6164_035383 [Bauhinia variegata]
MAVARSSLFSVGDKVEVTAECVSLRGALFPGEVVKVIPQENRLQVEFDLLKPKNEKETIVREMVDECTVRPAPPAEHKNDSKFAAGDIVDALYKGGWWEGTIVHQEQHSKFTVFFRFASIQVNLDASRLRHHQEWINGAWLPPLNNNNSNGEEQCEGQPETSAKGE